MHRAYFYTKVYYQSRSNMAVLFFRLRLFVLLIMLVPGLLSLVSAQEGNPYVTNYTVTPANLPGYDLPAAYTAILAGGDQRMYVANTKGVLYYNGSEWILTRTPSTPLVLAAHPDYKDRIYVGCQDGFGYLENASDGSIQFIMPEDTPKNTGAISRISVQGDNVYLMSEKSVYQWNVKNNEQITQVWRAATGASFAGLLVQGNQVFVHITGKGLHRIQEKQLQMMPGTQVLADTKILAAIPGNGQNVILTTTANRVWTFNGAQVSPLRVQAQSYLEVHQLSGGTDLSPFMYALSTVSGGCLVIDKQTGKTRYIVNYQTGLPDDEIQAVTKDNQGNLWIGHPMGISRADLRFPVASFATYPGLVGNVTQVLSLKGILYVATTEGVFYLTKAESYQQVAGLVKQKRQIERITKTITINERRGLFSRLFGSKANSNVKVQQKKEIVHLEDGSVITSKQKEIYALQSIPYLFSRVEGFPGKCRQLIVSQGQVLAAGSNGVFQINGTSCHPLLSGQYAHFMYILPTQPNRIFVGTQAGLYALTRQGDSWQSENYTRQVAAPVHSICQHDRQLWLGSTNQVWKAELNTQGKIGKARSYPAGLPYAEPVPALLIDGKPAFFVEDQLFRYDASADKLVADTEWSEAYPSRQIPVYGQQNLYWLRVQGRWQELSQTSKTNSQRAALLNLFPGLKHIYLDDRQSIWAVDQANGIYQINSKQHLGTFPALQVYLERVTDKKGQELPTDDITVDYDNNTLQFAVSTRQYGQETAVQYQYRVSGIGNEWSNWSADPIFRFPILPDGSFTLEVRARDAMGTESEISEYEFTVQPPFWKSGWFRLLLLLAVGAGVVAFVRYRTHRLREANRILEQRVQERTLEIMVQKEEIELQKNNIEIQKQELEVAYTDISKKNKHITSSINYARKIQQAILPLDARIEQALPESFVFFQPRDTVSGDFYWFADKGDVLIIAAVDCTGHGVPGAFMSMIGNTLLNQIVNEKGITEPALILNQLHQGVRKALRQEEDHSERQDGMDIALCTFYKQTRQLQYTGANNSLYLIQNGELTETKANKCGIGGTQKEAERLFTNHSFTITDTTACYLFTDGYEDQFGGPENRKFMSKRFKQLLVDIHSKPGNEQKQMLADTLHTWKGHEAQMDDILVIGFQVPVTVSHAVTVDEALTHLQ